MPSAEFLARFPQLLVVENFLDAELCARLLSEARQAVRTPAMVRKGSEYAVDAHIRNTRYAEVPDEVISMAQSCLLALKPRLENHFGVTLSGCQLPSFLAYGKGDFYLAHRDNADDPSAPQMARERQISVIVFLNRQSEAPQEGCYCGGSLTFYGLMADPRAASWGFPLVGEPGLFIAFRSNLLHEVTPVTHGERYTIATWFF